MKTKTQRTLALVVISSIFLPWQGAAALDGGHVRKVLSNAHLHASHPATLCGRGAHMRSGYVDLYAPLTASEAQRVVGYRDGEGRELPAPAVER